MNTKIDDKKISSKETPSVGRIGLFIDNYFPIVDGVVRVVDNYATQFIQRDIPVSVFCPRYKSFDDSTRVYPVRRISSLQLGNFEYAIPAPKSTKGLRKELLKGDYALFHVHSPFFLGRYALRIARKKKIPVIATFHSKFYDDFLQRTKMKWLSKLLTRYVVRFFEKCDVVWAVNEGTKKTLLDYGYHGDISVMPNGTHFTYPSNAKELRIEQRKEWNIKQDDFIMLFVGHLIWQKNIKVILDSLKILEDKGFSYHMIFVGEGGNSKEVKAYAEKLGLKNVRFVGAFKKQENLQKIYAVADLFYFPSVYDNAPLVLREASVMKIPALLAKDSNSAENIVDGKNGFLAVPKAENMAQKIEDIFHNKNRLEIGENASQTIPMTWDKVINQVVIEYDKIIKNYHNKNK